MKPKFLLLIVLSAIIFTGLIGAITFQNIFPTTTPYITNESTVNLSYGIHAGDGLSSITHSWNGTNTTLYNQDLIFLANFNNDSDLGESNVLIRNLIDGQSNVSVIGGDNVTYVSNGFYDGAYNFSGNKGGLNITFINSTTFSAFFWMNLTGSTAANTRPIVGNFFKMEYTSASYLDYQARNITTAFSGAVNNYWIKNSYHFYGITINNTKVAVWRDGVLFHSIPMVGNINESENNRYIFIGGNSDLTKFITGQIDDLYLFNRSLSSTEILELYNTQITRYNESYFMYNVTKSGVNDFSQDYFLCSKNLTGFETCSVSKFIINPLYINSNFSTSKYTINSLFYGVQAGDYFSEYNLVSNDMDCTRESISDYQSTRNAYLNAGFSISRKDMQLDNGVDYTKLNSTFSGNVKQDQISNIKWAYENGVKVLLIAKSVPTGLANTTSDDAWCNTTKTTCTPNNYTQWCYLLQNAVNGLTNNGAYLDAIAGIEIWNEPELIGFLSNLNYSAGNQTIRSREYNNLYNESYNCLKSAFPTLNVGGSGEGAIDVSTGQILFNGFLGSYGNQTDFLSFHEYTYLDGYDNNSEILYRMNWVKSRIDYYASNVTRLYLGEWNLKNKSYMLTSQNELYTSLTLSDLLNNYGDNLTQMKWKFDVGYMNSSCDSDYNYSMYSQFEPTYQYGYNVTKNFAHLCPAGGNVWQHENDGECVKWTTCSKGNMFSMIGVNSCNYSQNYTANLSMENGTVIFPYTSIMNYETGASIPVSTSGIAQLGVLDGYEILYLVNDSQAPTITITSPTGSVTNVVNYWFNVTLDEEGSWCGYSINGGTNVTMTQQGVLSQFKYLANIPNGFNIVTFYCNDTYGNMATASTYITGLTPSEAGTSPPTDDTPTTENEDGSSGAEELSLWDKIVAFVTEKTNEAREELIDKEITGQVIDDIPGEKTFMEKYIWLFIGLFLFMILVFSGRKGRF